MGERTEKDSQIVLVIQFYYSQEPSSSVGLSDTVLSKMEGTSGSHSVDKNSETVRVVTYINNILPSGSLRLVL